MAEDLKNNPSYVCGAYEKMMAGWQIMADTCAGTLCLRDKRSLYLPKEAAEDAIDYMIRRSRAIFFNAVDRTKNGLVGMVFRKEPQLGKDVPEIIRGREANDSQAAVEGQAENIDLAGTGWAVFAKELFDDAMRDGHALIYVDMPPALPRGSTLADERAQNRRPYWISYCADQVVNWRTVLINGKTTLTQIALKECGREPDGEYGEKEVVRYRVLRPGGWQLWRETTEEGNETKYLLDSEGSSSLPIIPVAVCYSRKIGFLESRPPLLDLALTNLLHYEEASDYRVYLHVASRPILWFRGRNTSKNVEAIGPYTFFDVDAQNGHVDYAEPEGKALDAARRDLEDLKAEMAIMGLSILAGQPQTGGPKTATKEILDTVRESSDLATSARSLKDCLERCLYFHALYLDPKAATGGSVELGSTVEELTLTAQDVQAYSNMVANKQLSLDSLWALLARAGKLPADFDPETEKEAIEADAELMADKMLTAFERGGAPDNDIEE